VSERLSILHVIESPSWTGAMAQTLELVLGLGRRGHRVTLATTEGSILWERAAEAGVDVVAVETRSELNPFAVAKLSMLVWTRRADIVHAHRAHAHSLGLLAAMATGRPFVVSRRVSFRPKDNLGSRLKYGSRFVTKVIAVSQAVKDVLVDYGVPEDRIRVIYSGSDAGLYGSAGDGRAVRDELGVPADAKLVGKVANYYHGWKGHDTFLGAAAELAAERADLRFILVGHRTDGEKMSRMIEQFGLTGRVVQAGYRDDVPGVISALDVSVNSPRAGEGLSGAIRESLAGGRPVVATDVGGNRELVRDGETGLLVPPDDPAALASALRRLLDDPELAARVARGGERFVREHLTLDRMVDETEALYREILARGRP
jgi:glycosyltransferase involved in cell wall biosynthesis